MQTRRLKGAGPASGTLFALLLSLSCRTPAPTAPVILTPAAIAAYATEVIDVFQAHSYYRDQIDWVSLRSRVAQTAAAGISKYATVELAISLVADNHSFYQARGGPIIFPFSTPRCAENAPFPPAFPAPPDIGYVQVRATAVTGAAAVTYAQSLQADIQRQDRVDLSGWIVDVRQNTGGNMWPMLAGIGPVLGEGLAGYFVDARDVLTPWGYTNGSSFINTFPQVSVPVPYRLLSSTAPVALLTDSLTNSSGEAVVVAFRSRPNTRSFGGATCGRSSSNALYTLSDLATLAVMTSVDADRAGNRFGGHIAPDESISDPAALAARAIDWIRTRQ